VSLDIQKGGEQRLLVFLIGFEDHSDSWSKLYNEHTGAS
jgi:hypothetical protein